jgi:PPOX class probable F420-dependent enzyme
MGIRLTDEEIWSFLETVHTGIFTTLRRDGAPISLPMWFVALDRAVYLSTLKGSKKAARLRRDPRVAFLAETGVRWAELKAVQFVGTAEVVTDAEAKARVAAAFDAKYRAFRTPREQQPRATREHYSAEGVTLRIAPEGRILSWDNAKLRLTTA